MATLNEVMKDTADAIREKKGTSELIAPIDFASEIKGITAGGGGAESDSQPNGAYRKLKFTYGYVDPRVLSEEQLIALFIILDAQRKGSNYTGFVCNTGVGAGAYQENYRSNEYQLKADASMAYAILYIYLKTWEYELTESDVLNEGLCFMWEEKDFEFEAMSISIIDYAKIILEALFGNAFTDEEAYESLMIEDVDKAYYEECKTKRRY